MGSDHTKNRKDARQPIIRELANKLVALAANKPPEADLLDISHRPSTASKWFRRDLRSAKIRIATSEGKATWHSLRKCYVNALVRSGADLKTLMELARHSSASLSMEVYASADPRRLRAATEAAVEHMKAAIGPSPSCTGVARTAVAGGGSDVTPDESRG